MQTTSWALLAAAIAALWWPRPAWLWAALYLVALLAGLASGVLGALALPGLALAAVLCWSAQRWRRPGWLLAAGALCLALALHRWPGFHNPLLVQAWRSGPEVLPFSLYANFDKASVGLFLMAWLHPRARARADWCALARPTALAALGCSAVVLGLAWALGLLRPAARWPDWTPCFLLLNLLFTCVAEEAFFRGLIQARLGAALAGRAPALAVGLPVLVSALLFGLAHLGGGPLYALMAGVAGLGYATVYARTARVEAAVLTHFALNAVHFLAFTYPALQR